MYGNNDVFIGDWKKGVYCGSGYLKSENNKLKIGEYEEGSLNGFGKIIYENKDFYLGKLKDGEFHGEGMLHTTDKKLVGEFENGKFCNKGTLNNSSINITIGLGMYSPQNPSAENQNAHQFNKAKKAVSIDDSSNEIMHKTNLK